MTFRGAKIALLCGPDILTYLRDDLAQLPFPAHWDLPGGGREGGETPSECALRELEEEFGLRLPPGRLVWHRAYPAPDAASHFFGGWLRPEEVATIRFGDEGQFWRMMPLPEFLAHPRAVPHLRLRTAAFLDAARAAGLDGPRAS